MAEFKQSIITCITALLALTPNAVNALEAHLVCYQIPPSCFITREYFFSDLSLLTFDININSTLKKMASAPLSKTTIKGVMTTFVEWGRVLFRQRGQSLELPYIQAFPRNPNPLRILAPNIRNTMSGRDLQISVLMNKAVFDRVSCFPGASIEKLYGWVFSETNSGQ